MVIFTDRGDSARVSIGSDRLILSDSDVTNLWWRLADHYDSDDHGHVIVTINQRGFRLTGQQMLELYHHTSAFIDKVFVADEMEFPTVH